MPHGDKSKTPIDPVKVLMEGNLQQVKALFTASVFLTENRSPLHYAACNKNPDVILFLLEEKKLDPNKEDNNHSIPLDWAIAKSTLEVMTILIAYGADYNRSNSVGLTPVETLEGLKRFKEARELEKIIEQFKISHQTSQDENIPPSEIRQRFLNSSSSTQKNSALPSYQKAPPSTFASLIASITSLWKSPHYEKADTEPLIPSNQKLKTH